MQIRKNVTATSLFVTPSRRASNGFYLFILFLGASQKISINERVSAWTSVKRFQKKYQQFEVFGFYRLEFLLFLYCLNFSFTYKDPKGDQSRVQRPEGRVEPSTTGESALRAAVRM